ncbi:hypothetical protein ACOSP7_026698 [Xanthoceras sorbifolium]
MVRSIRNSAAVSSPTPKAVIHDSGLVLEEPHPAVVVVKKPAEVPPREVSLFALNKGKTVVEEAIVIPEPPLSKHTVIRVISRVRCCMSQDSLWIGSLHAWRRRIHFVWENQVWHGVH